MKSAELGEVAVNYFLVEMRNESRLSRDNRSAIKRDTRHHKRTHAWKARAPIVGCQTNGISKKMVAWKLANRNEFDDDDNEFKGK